MSILEVAVSGSRAIWERSYVWAILDYECAEWMLKGYEIRLRLGDAAGVDSHAVAWARARNVFHTIYYASGPAYEKARAELELILENPEFGGSVEDLWNVEYASDWNRDGQRAGTMRNAAMLAGADILLAIHDGASPGTRDAISQAKMRSVFIHYWSWPPVNAESSALGYHRKHDEVSA